MGGRGAFANGKLVVKRYKSVGLINGIKVLIKNNPNESWDLPLYSNTSNAYIRFNKSGLFYQYREYDENHRPVLDIDLHRIKGEEKSVLHYHLWIDGKRSDEIRIKSNSFKDDMFMKYKNLLKEVGAL